MKLYGLIGFPLSHSFSAKYFAGKFAAENITDCSYQLFPIEKIEMLPDLIRSNPDLSGLNITIPYKEKVIPFLHDTDVSIKSVGAVNTIKIYRQNDDYRLKGFNTDVYGFTESLRPFLKPDIRKALVLGTGGAAKAVAYALGQLQIAVTWVSRNPSKSGHISYEMVSPLVMSEHKLIVNTSPAGMYPHQDTCPPIPYDLITADHILYDLVYNPEETLFLEKGKKKKATVISGLKMLYLQADKSWEIWNSAIL
jgi:shikimate dehydrogenase